MFRNGIFYNYSEHRFISKQRSCGKNYTTIYSVNFNTGHCTTMIVPYIICFLFKNDYLKHDKNKQNFFTYIDGNYDNCDANNLRANYYDYKILNYVNEKTVLVDICGYEVLLNLEFVLNELHKYNFRAVNNGKCIYFLSENTGKNRRLHQVVMNYYYPEEVITGAIDHKNHNTLDNTIENLNHINHIINSMNNMNISPIWRDDSQSWHIRYKIDGVGHSKTFSVYKYGSKENALEKSIEFINNTAIPQKEEYIKKKDLELKPKEFDNLIKYFVKNNMVDKIFEILLENGLSNPINK